MKNPKFIAFTGPASSGKTTLSNHLADILDVNYDVYVVNEVVRNVLKEWNMTLDELLKNPELFYQFQSECITRQIKMEEELLTSDYDFVIFDRSIHDYFVYAAIGLPPRLYDEYKRKYRYVASNYDLLVYCEPLEFVEDGVRTKTYVEKGEVGIFQMMVKPYATHVLDSDVHYKRLNIVLSLIANLIK